MTTGVIYNEKFFLRIPTLKRLFFLINHHWSDKVEPSLIYFHVGHLFITDDTGSLVTTDFTYQLGICSWFRCVHKTNIDIDSSVSTAEIN